MTINIGHDTVADQWGDNMMLTYQKIRGKIMQENTGEEFWGDQRHQWSKMIMAASHHGLLNEGKPVNIGHDTTAD